METLKPFVKTLTGVFAAIVLFAVAGAFGLRAASAQSPDAIRDLWATVQGKPGNLTATEAGRLIFAHSENGPNGPYVLEWVGRDYVTISSSTTSTKNVWRYNVPMQRIELHIYR